ncbi:hypothetical protein PI125_g8211 [Phytophthora idaei]|nr:hypothetical protein PI125_g8211 [Phytophthora idaei]
MWQCFGRSSDLGYVSKQHITMSAETVFYIRMLRMKTAEEQGLTLVPDREDCLTCPLHTLAVALVMQESSCASLLSQLPSFATPPTPSLDARAPLLYVLQVPVANATASAPLPIGRVCGPAPPAAVARLSPTPILASSGAAKPTATNQTRGENGSKRTSTGF